MQADAANAKGKSKGRKRKKSGAGAADLADDDSTPEPMQTEEDAMPSSSKAAGDIVSSSAYMLLYKTRGWQAPAQEANKDPVLPPRCLTNDKASFRSHDSVPAPFSTL